MKTFTSVAQMRLAFLASGQQVETSGYYVPGDGGGGKYLIQPSQVVDNFGDHDLAGTTVALLQVESFATVKQYGARADSALGVPGTDGFAACQAAIDSVHPIQVPEGHYSIEGRLLIQSGGSVQGGKTFICTSNTRLERFSAVNNEPLIQVVGDQNYVEGNGCILAARAVGGFTEGLLLHGVDPTLTDNNDPTCGNSYYNHIGGFKIIGLTANTGWDGSVGFYVNSASRKRGVWKIGGNTCNVYYNSYSDIFPQQFDYPIHVSSEASFNSFSACMGHTWGRAAVSCLGYGNQFTGYISESPTPQDTTERHAIYVGKVNDPFTPEVGTNGDPSATIAITGISVAAAAVVTTDVAHGLTTEDRVWLDTVVDNAPNGDLEDAVNQGAFQVTVLTATTFSIPLDTTGLTNTYVSGGTMQTDFLPNLGSRANYFSGSIEFPLIPADRVIRLMGWSAPVGAYDVTDIEEVYGENIFDIQGTHPGGIGMSGFTTKAGIGNNIVRTPAVSVNHVVLENHHGFKFSQQDDKSGSSFGTDNFKIVSGTIRDMEESFRYRFLAINNVGPTSAAIGIYLTVQVKDATGQDHMGGPISFMCPVTASAARQAKEITRNFQYFGNDDEPPLVPIVEEEAGTELDTGRFVLSFATQVTTGTGDFFCDWTAMIVSSQLEGTNLDWDRDIELLSSSVAGLIVDDKWARKTKAKLIDTPRNLDIVPSNDPHLLTWDVDNDTEYLVEGVIDMEAGVGGFRCLFNPSEATQDMRISYSINDASSQQLTDAGEFINAGAAIIPIRIHGRFRTNAVTGGNISFQWAQFLSNAANTIVYSTSYIKITRLDSIRSEIL